MCAWEWEKALWGRLRILLIMRAKEDFFGGEDWRSFLAI